MTARRDPDRLIHDFLMEGGTELADPVYDAVRSAIDRKRQRAVFGPWRMPVMNKLVPLGVGVAAVAVVAVFGSQLLSPAGPGVGGRPSPTPSPTVPASPSLRAPASSPEASPLGVHQLWRGTDGGVPITITIAAPGWFGAPGEGILTKDSADPPDGAGLIAFGDGNEWHVPSDPCKATTTMPDAGAATVDELVAALAAQASREASAPENVTLDGHAGKSITLHVPADADFSQCEGDRFCSWGDPQLNATDPCYRFHQGAGQIDTIWIVDVDGQTVLIDYSYYEGTPPADVAALEAMVRSITFE
jgi:hypothetical protein